MERREEGEGGGAGADADAKKVNSLLKNVTPVQQRGHQQEITPIGSGSHFSDPVIHPPPPPPPFPPNCVTVNTKGKREKGGKKGRERSKGRKGFHSRRATRKCPTPLEQLRGQFSSFGASSPRGRGEPLRGSLPSRQRPARTPAKKKEGKGRAKSDDAKGPWGNKEGPAKCADGFTEVSGRVPATFWPRWAWPATPTEANTYFFWRPHSPGKCAHKALGHVT